MSLKFTAVLKFKAPNLDLTEEMVEGAGVIGEEIRGNIKRGSDPSEQVSLPLNSPGYAKWKLSKLGHQKPLQAQFKMLINKASYIVQKISRNNVVLRLTNAPHPKSKATVSDIGAWNHHGTNKSPARPFFKVSEIARKRVVAKLGDKIARLVRG